MEGEATQHTSTIYKKTYLFTPPEDTSSLTQFTIEYRALSYKELLFLRENFFDKNMRHSSKPFILEYAIIRYWNIQDTNGNDIKNTTKLIEILPQDYINLLSDEIIRNSLYPEGYSYQATTGLDLAMDDKFQSDDWNCEECQLRSLHKQRNCGYVDKEEWSSKFMLVVGTETFYECPMFQLDQQTIGDMFKSYSMTELGLLPDDGGLYDQTEFFVTSSRLVKNKVKTMEKAAHEESMAKRGK